MNLTVGVTGVEQQKLALERSGTVAPGEMCLKLSLSLSSFFSYVCMHFCECWIGPPSCSYFLMSSGHDGTGPS